MIELKMWAGSNLCLGILRLSRLKNETKNIPYLREKVENFVKLLSEEDYKKLDCWWGKPFLKLAKEI